MAPTLSLHEYLPATFQALMSPASYLFPLTDITCSQSAFPPICSSPRTPNLSEQHHLHLTVEPNPGVTFSGPFPSSHRASQSPSPASLVTSSTASRPVLPSCSHLGLSKSHKCLSCFQITSLQSTSLFLKLLTERPVYQKCTLGQVPFLFQLLQQLPDNSQGGVQTPQ